MMPLLSKPFVNRLASAISARQNLALRLPNRDALASIQKRFASRTYPNIPGQWVWLRLKDHYYFYFFIGWGIMWGIIFGVHILMGPNELVDVPEGYEPHFWEYEKHPITQLIMKYQVRPPQKDHEMTMHSLGAEQIRIAQRITENRVRRLMYERGDYRGWYYRPIVSRWVENNRIMYEKDRENYEPHFHAEW